MEHFDFHPNYQMDELHHLYPGHGAHPPVDEQGDKQHAFDFQPYIISNQIMGNSMNNIPESEQEMFSVDQQNTQFDALLNERIHSMHSPGMSGSFAHNNVGQYSDARKTPATEVPDLSHMDMNSGFGMPSQHTKDGSQAQLSSMPQVCAGQNLPQQKPFPSLETSAITPASVFSTVSSTSTNDFLSPITSPMLQPQAGQPSIFGIGDNEMFNGNPSSPSHPLLNRDGTGAYPPGYSSMVKNNTSRSSVTSPISPAERPMVRRARATEKPGRVRPSPLMKPIQSPKIGPSNLVWGAYKRDGNSHSPALGAIESLSSTIQDANALAMPSPSLSLAMLALNGHGGNKASDSATRSHSLDDTVVTTPVKRDNFGEQANSGRGSLTNSPSPIDLAQNEHRGSPAGQAMPATPGTLMGLVKPPSRHLPPVMPQEQEPQQEPAQPSNTVVQESSQLNSVYPPPQAPPDKKTEPNTENMPPFNTQDAANAVAASAMVNAAQAPSNVVYMAPHHKTILPGGHTIEERGAWFNMRRMGHGVDQRRTSHKAAEQKRRDSLKYCFDELRTLLPAITVDDSVPGGSMLGPDGTSEDRLAEGFDPESIVNATSGENDVTGMPPRGYNSEQAREANRAVAKVLLLRHSNEYLIRLKRRIERRDLAVQSLSQEVVRLRALLANSVQQKSDGVEAKVSSELSSLSIQQNGISADADNPQTTQNEENDKHKK